MDLPRTASAVVIGGGVVGCSIAYNLARRGLTDVVVVERETVGSGTTSKAAGGIRVQFPTETEIRFSLEAIRVFERFEDEFGVESLERTNGRMSGVTTTAGAIASPLVINAAGPSAARIGRLAGVTLAVHPRRRHIFFTEPFPAIAGPVPLTTDVATGFYFRKELEQVLLSPGDVEDIGQDFDVPMDWSKVEEAVHKAIRRVPIIGDARIAGGWAGLRPLTPDDHAIIGWAPGVEGFVVAVGFGGHRFPRSPATGRYVAEWLLDGKPSLDLSLFDPGRFDRSGVRADKAPDAE